MKCKNYFPSRLLMLSVFSFLIFHNTTSISAQCTEELDADMAKYKALTETVDAQGCSQCAMLALYFCSAKYSVNAEDKRKVASLITQCKRNIQSMGQPYCCDELLIREPQWGILAGESSSTIHKDVNPTNTTNTNSYEINSQSYYNSDDNSAKMNFFNITSLNGDFNNIEELQNEYDRKISQLQDAAAQVTNENNILLQESVDALFYGSDVNSQAVGEIIVLGGQLINSISEEQRIKEGQIKLEQQREQLLAEIKAKELELQEQKKYFEIEMRKKILLQFPEGGVPLSFTKTTNGTVYFFIYNYNSLDNDTEHPKITVSDVFSISIYSDHTWPLKNEIKSDFQDLPLESTKLIGYYDNLEMAIKTHGTFIQELTKLGYIVEVCKYNEGAETIPSEDSDFWENDKTPKMKPEVENDFWDN